MSKELLNTLCLLGLTCSMFGQASDSKEYQQQIQVIKHALEILKEQPPSVYYEQCLHSMGKERVPEQLWLDNFSDSQKDQIIALFTEVLQLYDNGAIGRGELLAGPPTVPRYKQDFEFVIVAKLQEANANRKLGVSGPRHRVQMCLDGDTLKIYDID